MDRNPSVGEKTAGKSPSSEEPRTLIPSSVFRLPSFPMRLRESQFIERPIVVAPVGFDLDTQVQKNLGVEEPFEILAGLGADALDHLAAAADDDRLLRF